MQLNLKLSFYIYLWGDSMYFFRLRIHYHRFHNILLLLNYIRKYSYSIMPQYIFFLIQAESTASPDADTESSRIDDSNSANPNHIKYPGFLACVEKCASYYNMGCLWRCCYIYYFRHNTGMRTIKKVISKNKENVKTRSESHSNSRSGSSRR